MREDARVRFTITSDALLQGVAAVDRAISNNNVEPLLAGIYVEARDGTLRLVATDREIGIERIVEADVEQPGACVVDGKVFSSLVRKLPEERVVWRVELEGQATIEAGRARFVLQTRSGHEFPQLPSLPEGAYRIEQRELRTLIRHTLFATAREESRPFLTGVYFEIEGDEIGLAATDANRLAYRQGRLLDGGHAPASAIVPAKSLAEVLRLLSADDDNPIEFAFQQNQVLFGYPNAKFVSRLIEGQFPDYRRVFPTELPVKFTTDRAAFLAAVERASLVTRNGSSFVRLGVEDGTLVVSASEAEIGQAREEIPIEQEGDNLEMSYQARFLSDVLRVIEEERVFVGMGRDLQPALIHGAGDERYRYVVMPMRVG